MAGSLAQTMIRSMSLWSPPSITTNLCGARGIKRSRSRPRDRSCRSYRAFGRKTHSTSVAAPLRSSAAATRPGNCLLSLGRNSYAENPLLLMPSQFTGRECRKYKHARLRCVCQFQRVQRQPSFSIALNGNFKFYAGSLGTAGCVDISGSHKIGESPQPSGCTVNGISLCTDNYTQRQWTSSGSLCRD